MDYNFGDIERSWQDWWREKGTYAVSNDSSRPKHYVLDMFPYPSGAGLHVGHPLGYIASDIYARYKRLQGFNVLHPMGYDAFGLPAEQYAIETGQHPAVTTEKNIARYREQLDKIGFSFDWSRQVKTSDPAYYKWTQWIFLQIFHSWYDRSAQKARPVHELVAVFDKDGNAAHPAPGREDTVFSAAEWASMDEPAKREILMQYRLAYLDYAEVWWCEALQTVLANDEVINGVSERGGHPCVRRKMRQWALRITQYADRLLDSLDTLDWTDAMKEMQRNWIGKSVGAEVQFTVRGGGQRVNVFTTRPDTIYGVDFVVLAPEHPLVPEITTDPQKEEVSKYLGYVKSRSERERMAEVKQVTGAFTGAYIVHPFTGKDIPVWTADYVLAGYGTGAIMAVPSGDERDHTFAKHFSIPITNIFGERYTGEEAYTDKSGTLQQSGFLDGLTVNEAIPAAVQAIAEKGIGRARVNYRLRDAGFSRQRYWGEPFPIIYKDGVPYGTDELPGESLPVELPMVETYSPGPEGQGPLANIDSWTAQGRETNTMPGYAGSSWYFLRYADPHNTEVFADRKATDYWGQVDVYVGGTEHAVGHLLYSRMWTKVLHDLGHIGFDEPFKKLVNQGMIQGSSRFAYLDREEKKFVSFDHSKTKGLDPVRVSLEYVDGYTLDIDGFLSWRPDYAGFTFEKDANGQFLCGAEVEKMSKSKYNVVNPDDIVAKYGADTFRMYEMFLGPIEVSKPWDTQGIEGVHRFLKKLWRLCFDEQSGWRVTDDAPAEAALRILHKTIKKVGEDIERFGFNTAVSAFMICVNELSSANAHQRAIIEPLAVILAPFAPHMAEELWKHLGHTTSVLDAAWPVADPAYTVDNTKKYGVAVNGKTRIEMEFPLDAAQQAVQERVLAEPAIQKWMEGKALKKFIYVKGKMINVVV